MSCQHSVPARCEAGQCSQSAECPVFIAVISMSWAMVAVSQLQKGCHCHAVVCWSLLVVAGCTEDRWQQLVGVLHHASWMCVGAARQAPTLQLMVCSVLVSSCTHVLVDVVAVHMHCWGLLLIEHVRCDRGAFEHHLLSCLVLHTPLLSAAQHTSIDQQCRPCDSSNTICTGSSGTDVAANEQLHRTGRLLRHVPNQPATKQYLHVARRSPVQRIKCARRQADDPAQVTWGYCCCRGCWGNCQQGEGLERHTRKTSASPKRDLHVPPVLQLQSTLCSWIACGTGKCHHQASPLSPQVSFVRLSEALSRWSSVPKVLLDFL